MRSHTPNQVPKAVRMMLVLISTLLFAYCTYGIWKDDLYIPGRRTSGHHFHGTAAWLMYGAMTCACLVMLAFVVDHYDRRGNEKHYRTFINAGLFVAWVLFTMAAFW